MSLKLVFVASALAMFVVIPSANAATYCVGKPACIGIAEPSLAAALSESDSLPDADTIELGFGEYAGHFKNGAGRPVRITGMGPLTTIAPDLNSLPALTLTGAASSVANVGIELAHTSFLGTGLRLDGAASGDRIFVTAASGANDNTGIELGSGASLSQSEIDLGGLLLGSIGVTVDGDGATLSDVDIRAAEGVNVLGDTVVRRARIASGVAGLNLAGGTARVSSTLLDVRGGGLGIDASAVGDVSHVTIVGAQLPGRAGVRATGAAVLKVRDSIVTGMQTTSTVVAPATLSLDHVVRDPSAKSNGTATDTAPITIAPQFAGLGTAPFALVPGSALVDTGSDTPLGAGESASDLNGQPRIAGGCVARRDPGAYETAGVACPAPAPVTPVATAVPVPTLPVAPAADHTAPAISKLKLTRAKLTFSLSEAASVTVTVQRKRGRAYVKARTLKVTATAAGARTLKLALKPGHYRVLIDATDNAGNHAKTVSKGI